MEKPECKDVIQPKEPRLNVVIHGLWGIETNESGIRLTTPHVHNHVIRAGTVLKPEHDLRKDRFYKLTGVKPGGCREFRPEEVLYVGPIHEPDSKHVEVQIDLPYPSEIHSCRPVETNNQPFFEPDTPKTPPVYATIVQVLSYVMEHHGSARLIPSAWVPDSDLIVNLHVYAQPQRGRSSVDPEPHAKLLANLYGLDLRVLREVKLPPVKDPGVSGLCAEDMKSLFEGVHRVSPPTCDMFIFDNT